MKDKEFRKWFDKHKGAEAYAYEVWCAAWSAANKQEICFCESIQRCTIFDRCMKNEKD